MADEQVRAEIIAEDKTGPGVASAKRNLNSLQSAINNGRSGFAGLSSAANSTAASFSALGIAAGSFAGTLGAMGLSALAGGLMNVGRSALQSYTDFERLSMSINSLAAKEAMLTGQASSMQEAMAQTSGKSKELLDWIQQLAIASPFKQDDVAQAFRLSMALGFNTQEAQRLTQAMLNFSTATGAGGESMERISRALGQIRTKGRLSMEEVNQLTEAGVDVMRILEDATGKTGQALIKDISSGALSAQAAIEAIISDTERLYSGAGDAAANSMAGLLSTLEEIGSISGRNLLSGMFEEAQPYIASLVGIVTAPEFQAGLTAWGEKIGSFTADGLQGAAEAMERVDVAVASMAAKDAPLWVTTLASLFAAGNQELSVNITPTVTELKTPDGGFEVEVTPTATTIKGPYDTMLQVDVDARVVTIQPPDDVPPLKLTADWKKGTVGSLIASLVEVNPQIAIDAGWAPGAIETATKVLTSTPIGVTLVLQAGIADALWDETQGKFNNPFVVSGIWGEGVPETIRDNLQAYLTGFTIAADWAGSALSNLWGQAQAFFTQRPITAAVSSSSSDDRYGAGNSVYGPQMGVQSTAGSGLGGWDNPGLNDDIRAYYGNAAGTDNWRGGWTWVGEKGPELLNLPRGSQILSNANSKRMIGQLAEGTTDIPGWLERGLKAIGLWVRPQAAGNAIGPRTRDDAYGGWQDFQRKGTEAMQQAAADTGAAFENAAKDFGDAFESALQGVPGLFGASQVTGDQMRMAEMGIPQNFADDYLRQLSDEVLNGVDWEGVDIQDAARRAGIDPNLPNTVILELVKNAWNDSSLFANSANLDLINQDAVKAAIEQQQKEAQGKANIMALFGITDENAQDQADALGAGLASVFGQASQTDAMKAAGVSAFAAIGSGFGDTDTATAAVGGMAQAVTTATGTPDNQAALADAGKAGAHAYYGGWRSYMGEAAVVAPSGNEGTPPGPQLPPGRAIGTGFWQGGWMTVHANETIYAPRGTSVTTARESERQTNVINNYITVASRIDEEALLARMARRLRRGN
jgi:tape measure domain-containing protein